MAEDGKDVRDKDAQTEATEGGSRTLRPPRARRLAVAAVICALFLVADRLSKRAVLSTIALTGETVEFLPGILSFRYVTNTGAAFSLGEGMGLAFVALALVVAVAAVWYLARESKVSWFEVVGLGMVVGGAVGNAIDRMSLGYVVDFIATEFIDFPVFNVADIGVTVGVAVTFIGFVFLNPESKEDGAGKGESSSEGAEASESNEVVDVGGRIVDASPVAAGDGDAEDADVKAGGASSVAVGDAGDAAEDAASMDAEDAASGDGDRS